MKKVTFLLALLMTSMTAFAQAAATDFMRSTGKIYVVVAVIVVVFLGIVAFLIYLDRKLTKLERQINDND